MALIFGLIGICLRLGLLFVPRSFWGDEWESILSARGAWTEVIQNHIMDTHPPFYFLSLHAAGLAGGWHEWVFRMPSIAAGIGALAGIYFFTKEYFDSKTARAALFFAALSPYLVHQSFEIRNHGPALIFTAWGSFFLLKMLREPKKKAWGYAYAASAALATWTTHFAWFWAALCIALHARETRAKRTAASSWFFQAVFLLCSVPMMALLTWHGSHEAYVWKAASLPRPADLFFLIKSAASVFWHMLTGPRYLLTEIRADALASSVFTSPLLGIHVVSAIAAAILLLLRKRDARAMTLLIGLTMPVLVVAVFDPGRIDARYFAFEFFLFAALAAHTWNALGQRAIRITVASLMVFVWISGIYFIYRVPTDPFNRENYFDLARYLSENAKAGDISYCKSSLVRYYLDKMGLNCELNLSNESESHASTLRGAKRVWILEGARVGSPYFEVMREDMARFRFKPAGKEIVFGEKMLINRFDRDAS